MRNKVIHNGREENLDEIQRELESAFSKISTRVWADALRFAQDMQGAASHCGRRSCRQSSFCRMTVHPSETLKCGAGISDETIGLASALALFGGLMAIRVENGEFL